jgi:hypothetical protein
VRFSRLTSAQPKENPVHEFYWIALTRLPYGAIPYKADLLDRYDVDLTLAAPSHQASLKKEVALAADGSPHGGMKASGAILMKVKFPLRRPIEKAHVDLLRAATWTEHTVPDPPLSRR